MADQITREGEVSYARPLARALLRDRRITWGAKGLFAFLWDCPRNWSPNVEHLKGMGPERRDAIRSRLRELEDVGAMRREPLFGEDGKLSGSHWILRAPHLWAIESSLKSTEGRDSRPSEIPNVGKAKSKVHQDKDSANKREEHHHSTAVDKLKETGVIIQNHEDEVNAEKLVRDIGDRFDLIRNAVHIVRSRQRKNRPYLSTVARAALSLLADERLADQYAQSKACGRQHVI